MVKHFACLRTVNTRGHRRASCAASASVSLWMHQATVTHHGTDLQLGLCCCMQSSLQQGAGQLHSWRPLWVDCSVILQGVRGSWLQNLAASAGKRIAFDSGFCVDIDAQHMCPVMQYWWWADADLQQPHPQDRSPHWLHSEAMQTCRLTRKVFYSKSLSHRRGWEAALVQGKGEGKLGMCKATDKAKRLLLPALQLHDNE